MPLHSYGLVYFLIFICIVIRPLACVVPLPHHLAGQIVWGREAFCAMTHCCAPLLCDTQDHKAVGEGDTGPNTGGMGTYSPAPVVTPDIVSQVGAAGLSACQMILLAITRSRYRYWWHPM